MAALLTRFRLVALAAGVWLFSDAPIAAQTPAAGRATVSGIVQDASTGAPIDSVLIVLPALRISTYSDRTGAFELRDIPEGTHRWSVIRLGYVPLTQEIEVEDGDVFKIGVMPRPVQLQGVTVTGAGADRLLRRRRNAAKVPVRNYAGPDLLTRGAASAEQLVRSGNNFTFCPAEMPLTTMAADCIFVRGRYRPVSVLIDEEPAPGGLPQLAGYLPAELHSVEIWDRGTQVRVYTLSFMNRLVQGKARLRPRGF